MLEEELKDALDELGREVADMYPGKYGSVIFDIKDGELDGIREEFRRRPANGK